MSGPEVRLPPTAQLRPLPAIALRFALAGALVLLSWGMVLLERDSYTDSSDGSVSVIDALYYTTVTLTTTGYGDITPVTESARLVNALVTTPMRVLFVIILVGTTIQALTKRSSTEFRLARWRAAMTDHVIVLGYGTKGRNAVRALLLRDHPADRIVVVDVDPRAAAQAAADGYAVVTGDATRTDTLREAQVERAATAIVAVDRDDTAVLATLTIRRLSPSTTVVASAREAENAELLQQSGATSVVVSSETTGRLLGLATDSPEAVLVVEDLLSFGTGLDLCQRSVAAGEVGRSAGDLPLPVVAVLRSGRTLHHDDPDLGALRAGDEILFVGASKPG